MFRVLVLAAFISAPVFADDAGVASADSGVVTASVGAPVARPPLELPTPTVSAPDQAIDVNFVTSTAQAVKAAVVNKDWGRMIFLIVTALVLVTRKLLAPKLKFLQTPLTPTILSFLWASAAALVTTWPAGQKLSALDAFMALQAGLMGAGGFHILEAVLKHFSPADPTLKNWASVVNGWLMSVEPLLEKPKPADPPAPAPPAAPGV